MRVLAWPAFENRAIQPYNYLLYSHLQSLGVEVVEFSPDRFLSGDYDICHIHWPEIIMDCSNPIRAIARTVRLFFWMRWAKLKGTTIIWTAHNLRQHEGRQPVVEPYFWRGFTGLLDGWISLSESGKQAAEARYPSLRQLPSAVVPLGHYRGMYSNCIPLPVARERLGIPARAKVVTFVGQIRAYKNVAQLIRTFRSLAEPEIVLVITGRPITEDLEQSLRQAADGDGRVRLYLKFIPDNEMQIYLNSSDLVVLPYKDILNSSSALLALSFNVPVLVPAKGAMSDLQAFAGPDWIKTYEGDFSPTVLGDGLKWATSIQRTPLNLRGLEWDQIARQTMKVYTRILG
jgi:beta-1,4-mannosyltransferase